MYQNKNFAAETDPPLKPVAEHAFKSMCSTNEYGEIEPKKFEHLVKHMRLSKVQLKRFLSTHYNVRIANKIIALFDFSTGNLSYTAFYKQLDEVMMGSGISPHHQMDHNEHMVCLKQIAFNMYDMNSDRNIC